MTIAPANPAEFYFALLDPLSADTKLDLIVKLSQSLKQPTPTTDISLQALFGAYKSAQSADEIIAGIRVRAAE